MLQREKEHGRMVSDSDVRDWIPEFRADQIVGKGIDGKWESELAIE